MEFDCKIFPRSKIKSSTIKIQQGFTLIEMSIVLVIVGLIAGGILVGQDLLNAAAIQAQISQISKLNAAVHTFQVKYSRYLPGDIPDPYASQFGFKPRGQYAGEGDGNGLLEGVSANAPGADNGAFQSAGETVMFWVDLSAAGLIEGSFSSGSPNSFPSSNIAGSTVANYFPQANIGHGNSIYVLSPNSSNGTSYNGINYFVLAQINASITQSSMISSPALTVMQAYKIDAKIDDGLPQSGTVLSNFCSGGSIAYSPNSTTGTSTTCFDSRGVTSGITQYSSNQGNGAGVNCALSFKFQ